MLSAAALSGLLRGELGFTGVIISDAQEMRAVSDLYGIPEAAVLAVAAGTDLLCFGRDAQRYPAVRAVVSGLVAARPDTVVPKMGLPLWIPPASVHLATYGAARASAQAAAEVLGLAR